MAVVTKTLPSFTQLETPIILATGSQGAVRNLDLREKYGAVVFGRMARRATTTLTRPALISIRRTHNGTLVLNAQTYDIQSQIAAAVVPTVTSGGVAGTNTVTVSNATGLNPGDIICLHSTTAERVEFARIFSTAGAVVTVEKNFRVSHDVSDVVTNFADDRHIFVPGGDLYEITCHNNSGQAILFEVYAAIDNGDTIT
jgi:hypothetical protein